MPSSNVPWEGGCGPADPAVSANFGSYIGSGYSAARGGTGKVGTVNPGASTAVPAAGYAAQVRFFVGADNQLHALANQTNQDYTSTTSTNPQQPAVYSPTR